MIKTITHYRAGIYGEIARRQAARAARDARMIARLDLAADVLLCALSAACIGWAVWFTYGILLFK